MKDSSAKSAAFINAYNWEQFAARIDEAVTAEEPLQGKLIRVVRPVT